MMPCRPPWSLAVCFGLWLSLVERCVRVAEVVGSNPTSPTTFPTSGRWSSFLSGCLEQRSAVHDLTPVDHVGDPLQCVDVRHWVAVDDEESGLFPRCD